MMRQAINSPKNIVIFGIPLLIVGLMVFISKTALFQMSPDYLALGITVDLLLIVPLIYFLLIRKTSIPKTTIVPFLILGILICSVILPSENQYYLTLFKVWIFPILELSIISYAIYNVRKGIKSYNLKKEHSFDFFTTLKNTCYEILPKKSVMPVVTEIAVFYYGFINWKKRIPSKNEFTYHKNSTTITLLIAVIFIVSIETFVFHILLIKWNYTVAWSFTLLSIYSGIQLFGFLKSLSKRPYKIENGKLHLHYGILSEAIINLDEIETIEISSKDIEFNKETRKLSPLGSLESHNVVIKLKNKTILNGLYGIKREFKTLAFFVDEKINFKQSVETAIFNPDAFKFISSTKTIKKNSEFELTDKQKTIKYIGLVIAISWIFGFISFSLFNTKNELSFTISMLIFSSIPALIGYILNKRQGGNWKDLGFVKPKLKNASNAFLAPFLYFGVILTIQFTLGIRTYPDWEKLGTIHELILGLILGYPLMLVLLLGEEIGWRGYLQEKLVNSFGGFKGVLILGFTWGIWHLPISLQGYNLPNHPILESFVTTPLMCIALALMIAYFGLNSKSIFIGLLLHTSNNHFGGTFLHLTETKDEFIHAMVFSTIYVVIIVLFGILYWKKQKRITVE